MDRAPAEREVTLEHATALDAVLAMREHLPAQLVGSREYESVRQLAALQPGYFAWTVLECRLSEERQVDAMFCVGSEAHAKDEVRRLGTAALADANAARVVSEWAAPGGAPINAMPLLWLEYDLPATSSTELCPVVWFRLQDMRRWRAPHAQRAVLEHALSLSKHALSAATSALLDRLMTELPWGIIDVGSLHCRGRRELKLESRCRLDALRHYLNLVDWTGADEALSQMLRLAGSDFRDVGFQLEVGSTISPYLAIELPFAELDPAAALSLFERLARVPGFAAAKLEALAAWSGAHVSHLRHSRWPVHLQRSAYIKLVLSNDGDVSGKGYLCAFPRFTLASSAPRSHPFRFEAQRSQ